MDDKELKTIMASLYGFTATQLVQQISAINALERTLEDIKKGAKWQSLDLCLESAISTLEAIKNTPGINSGINSECSECSEILNISRIRTMTAKELAYTLAHRWFAKDTDDVYDWLMSKYTGFDRGYIAKMQYERSEKLPTLNIDYIRSLTVEELAVEIQNFIYLCEEGECPFDNDYYGSTLHGITEWLVSEHSERSEKEDSE